jgi:predicted nucleotidyltransferase
MKTNNLINDNYGIDHSDFKRLIDVISSNKKISEAILFGSRAKGNYNKYSDIDIALKANDLTFDEQLEIKVMIEELMMPYYVDVLDYDKVQNPDLKDHINRVGIRII